MRVVLGNAHSSQKTFNVVAKLEVLFFTKVTVKYLISVAVKYLVMQLRVSGLLRREAKISVASFDKAGSLVVQP